MTSTKMTELWSKAEKLLIDHEDGVMLSIPASGIVSRRYCESHQFIRIQGERLIVGPDAPRVADGNGGDHYIVYLITSEADGLFAIKREA